jgi:recombinational DNA repair protein RecR
MNGAGAMTKQPKMSAALAEDLSSVPRTLIRQLTTASPSSSREIQCSFLTNTDIAHMCTNPLRHTCMHIIRKRKNRVYPMPGRLVRWLYR